jgi:hypothetical protein
VRTSRVNIIMCVCVCVCVCVHVCACVCVCVCVWKQLHIHMQKNPYTTYLHTNKQNKKYAQTYIHKQTYTHIHIHTTRPGPATSRCYHLLLLSSSLSLRIASSWGHHKPSPSFSPASCLYSPPKISSSLCAYLLQQARPAPTLSTDPCPSPSLS